jgi:tRNA pseudouridine38-40 synthase
MRFFIYLSFRGSSYSGWQIQPGASSVQKCLENALGLYTGIPVSVTGAGRTDAGVHARNFVAHFDSALPLSDDRLKHIYKINAILPSDIVIHDIVRVNDSAHARFDALSRTYKYYIHHSKDPFRSEFSWQYKYRPDIGTMNTACKYLIGIHDFTSMAKLHSETKTNICNVTLAEWSHVESDALVFTITADRFLRNMVRAIVGSLLEVGRGRYEPETIGEILEAKDRCKAGNSVPAKALFLCNIEYPSKCFEI